jgi:hypothetical protein
VESFVFYTHYVEKMKKLPLEQAALLLYAICDYVENGTEPQLEDAAADMCFSFIRTQLDKDISRYEQTCKKRSEAGRRGAAATNLRKRQQEAAKPANAELAGELPESTDDTGNAEKQDDTSTPTTPDQSSELKEKQESSEVSSEKPAEDSTEENKTPDEDSPKEKKKAAAKSKKKKDPPKTKYGEFVTMYEHEYQALLEKFGSEEKVRRMIQVLDNYKGSNGRTYKSDYHAILSWVAERVEEEYARREMYGRSNQSRSDFTPSGEGWKQPDE